MYRAKGKYSNYTIILAKPFSVGFVIQELCANPESVESQITIIHSAVN